MAQKHIEEWNKHQAEAEKRLKSESDQDPVLCIDPNFLSLMPDYLDTELDSKLTESERELCKAHVLHCSYCKQIVDFWSWFRKDLRQTFNYKALLPKKDMESED